MSSSACKFPPERCIDEFCRNRKRCAYDDSAPASQSVPAPPAGGVGWKLQQAVWEIVFDLVKPESQDEYNAVREAQDKLLALLDASPAQPEPVPGREETLEAIARLVDPKGWEFIDSEIAKLSEPQRDQRKHEMGAVSFIQAQKILALLSAKEANRG